LALAAEDVAWVCSLNPEPGRPACISSFVKLSLSPPISCRYRQSGLLQGMLRKKKLQYFVVPNEALRE
jgi:hypothetical protein